MFEMYKLNYVYESVLRAVYEGVYQIVLFGVYKITCMRIYWFMRKRMRVYEYLLLMAS